MKACVRRSCLRKRSGKRNRIYRREVRGMTTSEVTEFGEPVFVLCARWDEVRQRPERLACGTVHFI